jgi:hypothetical protein
MWAITHHTSGSLLTSPNCTKAKPTVVFIIKTMAMVGGASSSAVVAARGPSLGEWAHVVAAAAEDLNSEQAGTEQRPLRHVISQWGREQLPGHASLVNVYCSQSDILINIVQPFRPRWLSFWV